MNKDINKPKAGLILWHESGDEIHWLIVSEDLYRKAEDCIKSETEVFRPEVEDRVLRNVMEILIEKDGVPVREGILEDGFTQTWCFEDPVFLNKYDLIGMFTIPMY